MIFSLLYTTVRARKIRSTALRWLPYAVRSKEVELIICVDLNRAECLNEAMRLQHEWNQFTVLTVTQNDPDTDCVKGWNKAAEACTGKVMIAISDDMEPPYGWDTSLREIDADLKWTNRPLLIHAKTGFVDDICTLPIMTRAYYNWYGYFFHPSYKSMFCDTDLMERAKKDLVLLEVEEPQFKHHHYNNGLRQIDEHDKKHGSKERWEQGQRIFLERKRLGFPK